VLCWIGREAQFTSARWRGYRPVLSRLAPLQRTARP